jgi:RNA polymerase sigma-70 factor, ECF subfamily
MAALDTGLVSRLYERSNAARWNVPSSRFASALEVSVTRALGDASDLGEVERYLSGLHLEDLALACACADGHDDAWEHFILQHRPVLYRSADALAPGGGARDIADALYGELFGAEERDGERRSLFRYFHGRSSLATWLRAVLSQRYVDRIRSERRLEPLPEEQEESRVGVASLPDPDRARYLALLRTALTVALDRLAPRDRLRLALYYAQQLTLAQVGRVLKEHESTVSRQLARTRGAIRKHVEEHLRNAGLNDPEIARCFESVMEDAGTLDLTVLFDETAEACKPGEQDRSK